MTPSILRELHSEIRVCRLCRLAEGRTHAVPGEGSEKASIMFVGEGPGFHEDQQGRPFVGPAGQFLTELLAGIRIKREEVFITNIVKCRPPGNRDPQPDEMDACSEYLDTQIAVIKPRIICALGRFAMARLIDERLSISQSHGVPYRKSGILYVALIHPAAALHRESWRRTIVDDFTKLGEMLDRELRGQAQPGEQEAKPSEPKRQPRPPSQLSFDT
jgi:uracil-DNA glycosylase family 4